MKLYTEEQMKRAIRFGFEASSLLDEGDMFIQLEEPKDLICVGHRYDYRSGRDISTWEERV